MLSSTSIVEYSINNYNVLLQLMNSSKCSVARHSIISSDISKEHLSVLIITHTRPSLQREH